MTDLFLEILNMSISAGWLVLAVLVLRLLLKKAPKWINVLLWAIVAVRLVLPVTLESELSLIPNTQTVSPEIMMTAKPTIDTGIPVINDAVNPVISQSFAPKPLASANPLQILLPVAANLWVLGIILMALYTLITYLRLRIKVRTAVRIRDNIYQTERIASPFVLGVVLPRIYLPFSMDAQDMDYVIAHENAHIRRKDHWWKPLGFFVLSVYWFNPLLWVGYILLCRDIELACDEKVVKKLEVERRADYSQALLNSSVNRKMIAACPLAFGEVGVKARVKSVLNYKKPAFWIILMAVVLCIAVAVCFLTDPLQPQYMLGVRLEVEYPADGTSKSYWSFYALEKAEGIEIPYVYDAKLQILEVTENSALINLVADNGELSPKLQVKKGKPTETSLVENNNKKIQFSIVDVSRVERQGKVTHWFGYGIHYFDRENIEPMQLPGKKNVTFDIAENCQDIIIKTDNGEERQINIDIGPTAAYFCDLTGDGVAELCMTVTRGSGFVEHCVMVYDYIKDKTYTMENRCVYDYVLLFEGGELIVTQHEYDSMTTVAEGALKMVEIEATGEYALMLQPVTYYSDPVPETDVRSLAVGDYVLDKMVYGDHEQRVEKLHRLTKRISITEDKIFYDYGDGTGPKVAVDWNWKSVTQLDEWGLILRETAFYKQAKRNGCLYQHINGGYYLFKDTDALYIAYLQPKYYNNSEQHIIQIYRFVPDPVSSDTVLYIKTVDSWGSYVSEPRWMLYEVNGLEEAYLPGENPVAFTNMGFRQGEIKITLSEPVYRDDVLVSEITVDKNNPVVLRKTYESFSVSNGIVYDDTRHTYYSFYLGSKRDVIRQGSVKEWFESTYPEKPSTEFSVMQIPAVTFKCNNNSTIDVIERGELVRTIGDGYDEIIERAYFSDVTGDGIPELCMMIEWGHDNRRYRLDVYDYATGAIYKLQPSRFSWGMVETGGMLYVYAGGGLADYKNLKGNLKMIKDPETGETALAILMYCN